LNWFAVVSLGAYPKKPVTASERACLATTYGLLDALGEAVAGGIFWKIIGSGFKKLIGG